jgi:uncharacterized DUF497 family protein
MSTENKIHEFDWDAGNICKSEKKHEISPKESEEIFLDENLRIVNDFKHNQNENRHIAIGKSFANKILFVVFTVRSNRIRVISARIASRKERKLYEEKTKENSPI